MKPRSHFIISVAIGTAVWFFMKSIYAAFVCFFAGTILDIDHFIDYIINHGYKDFTYKKFRLACEQTNKQQGEYCFRKIYLIFHSSEFAFVFWMLTFYTRNSFFLAFSIGYSVHLLLDHIGNPIYFYSYFTIWRTMNKFDASKMVRKELINKEFI